MTKGWIKFSEQTASLIAMSFLIVTSVQVACGQTRYATSDNASGYVHWIELYDAQNTRIDPTAENPQPYSPMRTCGRCHDYNTISHGWHFNATDSAAIHGRPGQPWMWSDARTGTHLPLSYRGWSGTHNPDQLGLSRWQVAAKLGGFMPGGGVGSSESLALPSENAAVNRSLITGELPVDCMLCHRNLGSGYSAFVWTSQIGDENFAYAPGAAMGLATVSGSVARLKDDFDPSAEDASSKLPKVVYDLPRFRQDGKVFFDLVRKPKSDACYYCHTNVSSADIAGQRWLHDEDVHLRAGLQCADCHRNSIDHQTVRGFSGEQHVAGSMVASLSCQGCHLGTDAGGAKLAEAGRFGAPQPAHRGLPPLHFEKMTCTACHSGPLPEPVVPRQVNSIMHRLGDHIKRTGQEFPGIVGPVQLPAAANGWQGDPAPQTGENETRYAPHRMMWPSFWATLQNGKLKALNPELVYELIRKPLKVKREFTEDLAEVKLLLSQRRDLLGEERARLKEEDWTVEEKAKLAIAETEVRTLQVGERIAASLAAIEAEFPDTQAVYISGGAGVVRKNESEIENIAVEKLGAAAHPYAWPIGHNVRPARQSLGATGCLECHSDSSLFFQAEIRPIGLLPDQATITVKSSELQKVDLVRLGRWNQLFAGRSSFKIAGLVALAFTCLVALSAFVWSVGGIGRSRSHSQDPN